MIESIFNVIVNIVMKIVKYVDFMSIKLSKLTLLLHLTGICFDLGIGEKEHITGNFRPASLFLSFRP